MKTVDEIMASLKNTQTTIKSDETSSSAEDNKNGSDATASPEATPITEFKSDEADVKVAELLNHNENHPNKMVFSHHDKTHFLNKIELILKTKMDSADLIKAMHDINQLLG